MGIFSTFSGPRRPLRRISEKRRAQEAARAECVRIVKERDKDCVFWKYVEHDCSLRAYPQCSGPRDVHEPRMRSHGADATNPDECLLLCRTHHDFVHDNPMFAYSVGLLEGRAS